MTIGHSAKRADLISRKTIMELIILFAPKHYGLAHATLAYAKGDIVPETSRPLQTA